MKLRGFVTSYYLEVLGGQDCHYTLRDYFHSIAMRGGVFYSANLKVAVLGYKNREYR